MENKQKLYGQIDAQSALEVCVDKVFMDRLYEFTQNLMLEAENKVEELWDVTALQERCDKGEKWSDAYRVDLMGYINNKLLDLGKGL